MPVKSLTALCMQTILKHINLVTSVGNELPHDNPHVQKILSKVTSAHQLHQIELNSPQLQGFTENFWKELIRRHFPGGSRKKNYVPSDATGWYKVYKRYKKEDDESLEAANAALRNAYKDIAAEKEKNESLVLNRSQLPKPPRTGRAFGIRRGGQQATNTSSLAFNAGSRTKLNSGKNVLKRARREAADVAAQRGALGRQAHAGGAGPSLLKTAPASFLERNRVASQPPIRAPSGLSTKTQVPASRRHWSPDGGKEDGPEPIIVNASDEEHSDPLFDDVDEQAPLAKKSKLGPKRSGLLPKDPLFDSDSEEGAKAMKPPTKPRIMDRLAAASSQANPLKRKVGALLPGKPGAGRFINTSSATPGGKTTASQKPSQASLFPTKPSMVSVTSTKGVAKQAPKAGQDSSPPPTKNISRPATNVGRASSPPQDKPVASGSTRPPPILPRKKKVDIFMKPRKRP